MLDRYVIGQSSATQSIAMAVAQHFLACEYNESCDEEDQIQTDNILIIGPSGCGKSETIRVLKNISEKYNFPLVFESASNFAPNDSWKGVGINNIVSRLFMAAGDIFYGNHLDADTEFATSVIKKLTESSGIIVLDEADKIFKNISIIDSERSSSHDYQSSLLKLIEGTNVQTDTFTHNQTVPFANSTTGKIEYETIEETIESTSINTEGILWILLGAFEGLDKITAKRIQRENNKDITTIHDYYQCCHAGFIQDKPIATTPAKINLTPTIDDLVAYGMKKELAGRLPIRVQFNPLTANALIKIMLECPTSAYREYQRRVRLLGHTLIADSSALRYIAQTAVSNGTGARGLRTIFNDILSPVMFQLSAEPTPHICKLTGKLLKSGKPPIIEKKQKCQQNTQNTQSAEEIMEIINNSTIRKAETA